MQSIDFIRTQGSRTVALQAGGQRGSGLVIGAAHSRIRPYLPILIAGVLMAACAGSPSWKTAQNASSWQANSDGPALQMPSYIYRADALRRQPIVRRATGIAQATEQMARTWYLDPFVRPISTGKSLYAVVFKSSTGFVQRLSIDVVQFPLLEQTAVPPVANRPGMNLDEWENDLDRILRAPSSNGTIEFLIDGHEYFPRLETAIHNAQESVDVRTYIFDNDDYAVRVADLLKFRSADIDVKVLLDGFGALLGTQTDPENMPANFSPPLSMQNHLRRGSRVKVRTHTNPWFTGDHVKSTIIDGELAFVGGMNIGREYRYDWHDMMMAVTGPVVNILQRDSDTAWNRASLLGDFAVAAHLLTRGESQTQTQGYPVRALFTREHDSQIYRAQLEAIRQSQSYIYIENPYVSDDRMLYELARARRRGVDVRIILPAEGNHETMNRSNMIAISTMLNNGIRVYLYPGMTHIKAAVYDGWACMGSANFDKMSLEINKELNLSTSDQDTVNTLLDRLFIPDLELSAELHTAPETNWTHRLAEIVADEVL